MTKRTHVFWRKPGRRDEERKKFATLMRKVEAVRICCGLRKGTLATALETTPGALCAWMTRRTVGRKETVAEIEDFLKRKSD